MRTVLPIAAALVVIFLLWGAWRRGDPRPPEAGSVEKPEAEAAIPARAPGPAGARDPVEPPEERVTGSGASGTASRGRVLDLHGSPLGSVPILVGGTVSAYTDRDGSFPLPAEFSRGPLHVRDPWVAVYTETVRGTQPGLWIVAATALDVEGAVTDPDGQPLAEVEVSPRIEPLVDYPHSLETARRARLEATSTDAEGRFAIADLPLDAARVEFSKPGFVSEIRPVTLGSPLQHITLSPMAGAGRLIRGIVFDPWRQPLVDARVGLGVHEVRTDMGGEFEIVVGPEEEVARQAALWAAREDLRTAVVPDFGSVLADSTGDLYRELQLPGPALEIAGRVVYDDGEPAAGVVVYPWREKRLHERDTAVDLAVARETEPLDFGAAAARSYARTGVDGSFRLGGFADRSYTLRVLDRDAGWGFSSEPIVAGTGDVTIRLPADLFQEAFTARVVTPDAKPVAGLPIRISLSVYETAGNGRFLENVGAPFISDGEGRITIPRFSHHGVSFWVGGQTVGGIHYLSRWEPAAPPVHGREVTLVVERRCRFRVQLTDPFFASAKIHLLDSSGNRVRIQQMLANSVSMGIQPTLRDGKSIELGASEKARVLVAVAGERKLEIPIQLRFEEVTLVTR